MWGGHSLVRHLFARAKAAMAAGFCDNQLDLDGVPVTAQSYETASILGRSCLPENRAPSSCMTTC